MVAKSIRFELTELNSDEFRIDSNFDKKMRSHLFVKNEKRGMEKELAEEVDEIRQYKGKFWSS